eukprot:5025052-Pleurochrysis_carterae.AAC.1
MCGAVHQARNDERDCNAQGTAVSRVHAFDAPKAASRVAAPLPYDVQATSKAATVLAPTAAM